ncbi:hypothetical protein, partial [Escherichia coli]|uniref:hypothetical protein n=1 Tax=Escherichia coli TaxID=562 RepID=UPI0019D596F1
LVIDDHLESGVVVRRFCFHVSLVSIIDHACHTQHIIRYFYKNSTPGHARQQRKHFEIEASRLYHKASKNNYISIAL